MEKIPGVNYPLMREVDLENNSQKQNLEQRILDKNSERKESNTNLNKEVKQEVDKLRKNDVSHVEPMKLNLSAYLY